jgi:hypothetical protein
MYDHKQRKLPITRKSTTFPLALPNRECPHQTHFLFLHCWSDTDYSAHPEGINDLYSNTGMADKPLDIRTVDKLFDGVNDTYDDSHMWLTPQIPSKPTYLYVFFDQPVAISMMKIWNYSKTPARGTDHLQVHFSFAFSLICITPMAYSYDGM